MGKTVIRPELEAEFAGVAASVGCELLEVEFSGNRLRVFLDHPDGVTLKHCETVSRQLSALLDVAEFGSTKYVLEVSSPGLDRKLYTPEDYDRFTGHLVRVTYLDGPDKKKKTIVGRLEGFDAAAGGLLTVLEQGTDKPHRIALSDVTVARLEVEL